MIVGTAFPKEIRKHRTVYVYLTVDPPPDLATEVDVTSKTGLDAYLALGVPELWRFEDGRLRISLLQDGQYQDKM